jgi:hypothetical protein
MDDKKLRQLRIKAENFVIKNRLELEVILTNDYNEHQWRKPIFNALVHLYEQAYIEGTNDRERPVCLQCQEKDETIKELENRVESLEEENEDLTNLTL